MENKNSNDQSVTLGQKKEEEKTNVIITNTGEKVPHPVAKQMMDDEFQDIIDVFDLPSKGVFYPNGQSQVKVKYLLLDEDDILSDIDLIKSGKVLDVLLDNVIKDSTLSSEQMLTIDRNAVLIHVRREGFGDNYEVKMACPSCGNEYIEEVNLSELKNKSMETMPDDDITAAGVLYKCYSVTLPKTKWTVSFRLLNGADEAILAKAVERVKKTRKGNSYKKPVTESFRLQIMKANEKVDRLYIDKVISHLPIMDVHFLKAYIRETQPGIDMEYTFTCKDCGHNFVDDVPMTVNLFWPSARIR